MNSAKKWIGKLSLLVVLFSLTGCAVIVPVTAGISSTVHAFALSTPYSESNDSYDSWRDDYAREFNGAWKSMGRDIKHARRTFDRVFLNYDWEESY